MPAGVASRDPNLFQAFRLIIKPVFGLMSQHIEFYGFKIKTKKTGDFLAKKIQRCLY